MNVNKIKSMKAKEKIAVLTAYDYNLANIMDNIVDLVLVGDSLGMVVLGYDSTKQVTMQDMIRHTQAVAKGAKKSPIVADLPYQSDKTEEDAIKNAKLLIKAGASAVKPEGKLNIVKALVKENIPVMAHIGLLPQTAESYSVQGKDEETADKLIQEAKAFEKAGAFAIVLESIPYKLANTITESVSIPTIGIGAGPYCDGQVLVSYDMLGLYDKFKPKFARQYVDLREIIKEAIINYKDDIKKKKFPTKRESYE
jgi:3-methyl-2-oxobutanoate hydroxymethyltransferase